MVGKAFLLCTSALAIGLAGAAQAADNGGDQIVVTAQKREQRLQDVPVVVTVLNTKQLQDAGVRDVRDLTLLTPGLSATTNATEATTTVRIRGIGTVADNSGLEDGVGIYIDNVYRPRNGVGFNDLGELSDVEVLKGPQGTLFGKNTVGGVIQIETKRPQFKFGAQGEVTVQNYGGYGGSMAVTGPLVDDKVAARLYLADRQRDGWVPVTKSPGYGAGSTPYSGPSKMNDEHMFTTRDQLLFAPNSNFDVNFIADYTKRDDHCCVAVEYIAGVPTGLLNALFPGSSPASPNPHSPQANLSSPVIEHITESGVSGEAHWTTPWFNGAKLTSVTAYRDWKDHAGGDTDVTGADLLDSPAGQNSTEFKQLSEELRYSGEAGPLVWQVGAFFDHEDLYQETALLFGTNLGTYINALSGGALPAAAYVAGEGTDDRWHQTEHSESVYTQDEFKVTDKFSIIGGLRYTSESKSLSTTYTNNDTVGLCQFATGGAPFSAYQGIPKSAAGIPCLINPAFAALGHTSQSLREPAWTGTLKVQYKFSDRAMTYASYSRGNLVGGYNLAEVTLPFAGGAPNTSLAPDTKTDFPAEWVDAFEIGAKSQLWDRRVSLNGAVFYQKYKNFQLNAFTGTEFVEDTIPDAVTEGVELETYITPTHGLVINAGATYADTYYPNSGANKAALTTLGNPLYLLPGSNLSFAPFWSITAGVSYEHEVASGLVGSFALDGKYSSAYNTGSDHDPHKLQDGYALFNGRIGISPADHRWSLEAWAANLFDVRYKLTAYDGVLQTFSAPTPSSAPADNNYMQFPAPPRFFGVTFRIKTGAI